MMEKTLTLPWDPAEHLTSGYDIALYLQAALDEGDPTLVAAALDDIDRAKGVSQFGACRLPVLFKDLTPRISAKSSDSSSIKAKGLSSRKYFALDASPLFTIMTDQELKDLVASLAVKSDRLDALQVKTDTALTLLAQSLASSEAKTRAEVEETVRVVKEVSRRMGSMASNQGDVAEEFFFTSLSKSKQIGPIHFDDVQQKVYGGRIGAQQEYDLVLLNGDSAAIVEVKYKVHPSSLAQLQKQLELFKVHFPEYKDMKLYGGVAGFSVPDEVTEQAHEQGFFVLKRQGESFAVDTQSMKAF